jgi:hypothetical protein
MSIQQQHGHSSPSGFKSASPVREGGVSSVHVQYFVIADHGHDLGSGLWAFMVGGVYH